MKEYPILFRPVMVQAILAGRKSQTRRVVTAHNSIMSPRGERSKLCWDGSEVREIGWNHPTEKCPAPLPYVDGFPGGVQYLHVPYNWAEDGTVYRIYPRWNVGDHLWVKENLFTSRKDSLITLEITAILAQRLQDITEDEARAEGVESQDWFWRDYELRPGSRFNTARKSFISLWQSINGKKHPWETNPWVWVYEFRLV